MHRIWTAILIPFLGLPALSQDVSGIWKGKLTQEPGGCYPEYYLELQIKQDRNQISGVSYDYYNTSVFVKFDFTGTYNETGQKLRVVDKKILAFKIPPECSPCVKTYTLQYEKRGDEERLVGSWYGFDYFDTSHCPPGRITLVKIKESAFRQVEDSLARVNTQIKRDSLVKAAPAPVFANRKNELVQTIMVDTPFIKVELYDNGEIDGDTLSVYLNNRPVALRQRLTDKPVTLNIPLVGNTSSFELIMVAENLGTIPPNTSLMVVHAGEIKYELRISSSDQKNAMVRFQYIPKPAAAKRQDP